jgi:hypothetical protein
MSAGAGPGHGDRSGTHAPGRRRGHGCTKQRDGTISQPSVLVSVLREPGRRLLEDHRDRSAMQDQDVPAPGGEHGRGIKGPEYPRAQLQLDQAHAVARRLAATGKPVSRRGLRSGGVRGSNQALSALARMISAEQAVIGGGRTGSSEQPRFQVLFGVASPVSSAAGASAGMSCLSIGLSCWTGPVSSRCPRRPGGPHRRTGAGQRWIWLAVRRALWCWLRADVARCAWSCLVPRL